MSIKTLSTSTTTTTTLIHPIKDWSLITGMGGGLQNGKGACKVIPLRKGRAETVLVTLKGGGGGTTSFGVLFKQ